MGVLIVLAFYGIYYIYKIYKEENDKIQLQKKRLLEQQQEIDEKLSELSETIMILLKNLDK